MKNKGIYPLRESGHLNNVISLNELEYLMNRGKISPIPEYSELVSYPTKSPFESAYQNEIKTKINEILSTLHPREADVVRYRHKMKDLTCRRSKRNTDEPTFDDIGREIGVTGCRVRQIYEKAMRKLRKGYRIKKLIELLD